MASGGSSQGLSQGTTNFGQGDNYGCHMRETNDIQTAPIQGHRNDFIPFGSPDQERDEDHGAAIFSKPGRSMTTLLKITPCATEEIDHISYQGAITGNEAEMKLKREGEPCYLTRFSINYQQHILSIMTKNEEGTFKFSHIAMKISADNYEIEGTGNPFGNIQDMLSHYEENPIHNNTTSISSIGRPCSRDGQRQTMLQHEQHHQPKSKEEKKDEIVQGFMTMHEKYLEEQKNMLEKQHEMMEKNFQQQLKEQRQDFEKKLEQQQKDFEQKFEAKEKKSKCTLM